MYFIKYLMNNKNIKGDVNKKISSRKKTIEKKHIPIQKYIKDIGGYWFLYNMIINNWNKSLK